MHHHHHPHPGAVALLAEITTGAGGGVLASALGSVPPWLGGALSALVVGLALRLLDPVLRRLGERLAERVSAPSQRPSQPPTP